MRKRTFSKALALLLAFTLMSGSFNVNLFAEYVLYNGEGSEYALYPEYDYEYHPEIEQEYEKEYAKKDYENEHIIEENIKAPGAILSALSFVAHGVVTVSDAYGFLLALDPANGVHMIMLDADIALGANGVMHITNNLTIRSGDGQRHAIQLYAEGFLVANGAALTLDDVILEGLVIDR